MKKQKNIRMSEPARERLAQLTELYGNETMVVEIAIDRLYEQEKERTMKAKDRIKKALKDRLGIEAHDVYKGYEAHEQEHGWYYRHFQGQPRYLGKSEREAMEWIDTHEGEDML